MKNVGLIFTRTMAIANSEGYKTMTRRTRNLKEINKNPDFYQVVFFGQANDSLDMIAKFKNVLTNEIVIVKCPVRTGDIIYQKETWATLRCFDHYKIKDIPITARHTKNVVYYPDITDGWHMKRSAMFMPRWASRFEAKCIGIRCERLSNITYQDVIKEGLIPEKANDHTRCISDYNILWDNINAKKGMGTNINPYLFVYSYERI